MYKDAALNIFRSEFKIYAFEVNLKYNFDYRIKKNKKTSKLKMMHMSDIMKNI